LSTPVIPAQAGIQQYKHTAQRADSALPGCAGFSHQLDSGLRRNDDLTGHQN
jgi:hypothetical protein